MPTLTFSQRASALFDEFDAILAIASGEEKGRFLRIIDGMCTGAIRTHNLAASVPIREPLAVTLGLVPVQAPGAAYCIACGKHHAQPSECPYDTCRA